VTQSTTTSPASVTNVQPPDWSDLNTNGSRAQATPLDTEARLRQALERIFGPATIDSWLVDGIALPAVRPEPPNAVLFEGRVGPIGIQPGKDGDTKIRLILTADLAGAPVDQLARLSGGPACEVRLAPNATQLALNGFTALERDDPQELKPIPFEADDPNQPPEDGDNDDDENPAPPPPPAPQARDPRRRGPAGARRVQPT
jgi:hypothetical protein